MTTLAFRSSRSAYPHHVGTATSPPSRRETLAIVSTRSKLCGIAAYTAALRQQLKEAFDVTVFDLDQYLLRSTQRRVRRLGDRHIKDICRALAGFDAVNLQLEHGTLGRDARDIDRRFGWLFAKALAMLKWRDAFRLQAEYRRNRRLAYGITGRLRRTQRWKQVTAIVHNR